MPLGKVVTTVELPIIAMLFLLFRVKMARLMPAFRFHFGRVAEGFLVSKWSVLAT